MDEARLRPDYLGQMGQKGDDVVLGLAFDRLDAGDVENGAMALFPNRFGRLFRYDAKLGHRRHCVRLDLEPDAEFGFRRPDGGHFRARITRNHRLLLAASVIGMSAA